MIAARSSFAVVVLAVALAWVAAAPAKQPDLGEARQGTAAYHDADAAQAAGYGLFTDAQGIACIEKPGVGAMGIHYAKGELVGDGAVDARTPEVLVYERRDGGGLKLVAVEYVVFQDAWDAHHADPPSLFGHEFEPVAAGNRYGLPPFYALHAWLWKHNPRGMFDDWNPRVRC